MSLTYTLKFEYKSLRTFQNYLFRTSVSTLHECVGRIYSLVPSETWRTMFHVTSMRPLPKSVPPGPLGCHTPSYADTESTVLCKVTYRKRTMTTWLMERIYPFDKVFILWNTRVTKRNISNYVLISILVPSI